MVERYLKTNVCVLPWTHLEIDVNGGASPCCLFKGSIENYKVYETDLKTIQTSSFMNKLREEFRGGKRPIGCSNCWAEEDSGKTSKRMNSIYKMKRIPEQLRNKKYVYIVAAEQSDEFLAKYPMQKIYTNSIWGVLQF